MLLSVKQIINFSEFECDLLEALKYADSGRSVGIIYQKKDGKEIITDYLLKLWSGVDGHKLKTGKLNKKEFDKLSKALLEVAEMPIYIIDKKVTINQLKKLRKEYKVNKFYWFGK